MKEVTEIMSYIFLGIKRLLFIVFLLLTTPLWVLILLGGDYKYIIPWIEKGLDD